MTTELERLARDVLMLVVYLGLGEYEHAVNLNVLTPELKRLDIYKDVADTELRDKIAALDGQRYKHWKFYLNQNKTKVFLR